MQRKLYAIPVTIKEAMRFVRLHHRHLPRVQGGLFAVGVGIVGETTLRGVAIVGRPAQGIEEAASVRRPVGGRSIAQKMGYRTCGTKTREDEPGTSLRAAGFEDDGLTRDQHWSRPSRPRDAVKTGRKRRWKASVA